MKNSTIEKIKDWIGTFAGIFFALIVISFLFVKPIMFAICCDTKFDKYIKFYIEENNNGF